MDNKILEEIIRLNKDKKPFCTVSKINDDNVEIIILDNKELSDIQKLAQDAAKRPKKVPAGWATSLFLGILWAAGAAPARLCTRY